MSSSNNGFWGFLTGFAAGVAIGVLYAPDKGKNTRDKLSYRLEKYSDKLKNYLESITDGKKANIPVSIAKSEGQKVIKNTKEKAERLLWDVEELMGQIKQKKEEA